MKKTQLPPSLRSSAASSKETAQHFFSSLKKYPVLIIGFTALTGFANAQLLMKWGVKVVIHEVNWDQSKKKLLKKLLKGLKKKKAGDESVYSVGDSWPMVYHCLKAVEVLTNKKLLKNALISPGVPRSLPPLQRIGEKVTLWCDYDFFYPLYAHKAIVAVTGTNGKTSVVSLVSHLLNNTTAKGKGKNQKTIATAVGNIGVPIASLKNFDEIDVFVFELSSFMLEKMQRFRPNIALITNFASDHLDRYTNTRDYFSTKCNIFKCMLPNDYFILNLCDSNIRNSLLLKKRLQAQAVSVLEVSDNIAKNNYGSISNPKLVARWEKGFFSLKTRSASWQNVDDQRESKSLYIATENILLALTVVATLDKLTSPKNTLTPQLSSTAKIAEKINANFTNHALNTTINLSALWSFEPPLHRMQPVKLDAHLKDNNFMENSLLVINDSKATTPESVLTALSFFNPIFPKNIGGKTTPFPSIYKVVLILGGKNKQLSFSDLQPHLPRLQGIVVYGEARSEIFAQLKQANTTGSVQTSPPLEGIHIEKKFDDAFNTATSIAEKSLSEIKQNKSIDAKAVLLLSPGCASYDQFKNFEDRGNYFSEKARKWMLKL